MMLVIQFHVKSHPRSLKYTMAFLFKIKQIKQIKKKEIQYKSRFYD